MILCTGPLKVGDYYSRYPLWPIRLGWYLRRLGGHWSWGATRFFDRHGVQIGGDGVEQWVVTTTLHVGPLKIYLGKAPVVTDQTLCKCGVARRSHTEKVSRMFCGLHCPDDASLFSPHYAPRALSIVVLWKRPESPHVADRLMEAALKD